MKIGVLAMQGAFAEHIALLDRLGVKAVPVRLPQQLDGLDGLIIPGGESTTISKLMLSYDLMGEVKKLAGNGLAVFGTCAGLVLLANDIVNSGITSLGVMDIAVKRNAFGRQQDSFETDIPIPVLGDNPFHAVFIRAPIIEKVGNEVEILARLPDGIIVAARQGRLLAAAFHPELTQDLRFHRYFLDIMA